MSFLNSSANQRTTVRFDAKYAITYAIQSQIFGLFLDHYGLVYHFGFSCDKNRGLLVSARHEATSTVSSAIATAVHLLNSKVSPPMVSRNDMPVPVSATCGGSTAAVMLSSEFNVQREISCN